jgi:single stranded DNA-binding protein
MASINKVILLGKIGSKRVHQMKNGGFIVNATLCTNSSYKKADGGWAEINEWHKIVVSIPQLVERIKDTIAIGDTVLVEGSITTNKFKNSEGIDVQQKEISCTSWHKVLRSSKDNSDRPDLVTETKSKQDDGLPI